MSDFLDVLERELLDAAGRRARGAGRARGWASTVSSDLRALGSGAMVAASIGAVALVIAVLAVTVRPGADRAAAGPAHSAGSANSAGPTRSADGPASVAAVSCHSPATVPSDEADGRALRALIADGRVPSAAQRREAARDLDPIVAGAVWIDARAIRTVRLPGAGRVVLVPTRACPIETGRSVAGAGPQATLFAEVRSRRGTATVRLGTPAQIDSGAAFSATRVLVRSGHGLRLIAMVPPRVVRVVCRHLRTAARRSFPVVDHLVAITGSGDTTECGLVHAGAGASSTDA